MDQTVKPEAVSDGDDEFKSATSSDSEDSEDEHSPEIATSAHWTADERALLLASIKQYGMLNVDYLAKILKTKTSQQIKEFFRRASRIIGLQQRNKAIESAKLKLYSRTKRKVTKRLLNQAPMRKRWSRLLATEMGLGPIDSWLKIMEEKLKTDSAAKVAAGIIPKALSIITQYENHPHPRKCGGVDLREAYDYLYHVMSGVPPKSLKPETAVFIKRSIKRFLQSLKDAMYSPEYNEQYGEQVDFLIKYSDDAKKIPSQTYVGQRTQTQGLLSPSLAMRRLTGQSAFNPLKVPDSLTWKQSALYNKTPSDVQFQTFKPSDVQLVPFENSFDDVPVPCTLFSDITIYRHGMSPRI